MTRFASIYGFIVFLLVLLIALTPKTSMVKETPANKNECVKCHTNLKKLLLLSVEIEKIRPKPAKSAETAGEG